MDPNMMKAAMDMMKNMPQDQLQAMMSSMGNISPEMMAQAQRMAANMKPEDLQRAQEEMKNMQPEQLRQQASQAKNHFEAQQKYTVTASVQLKNEGNQLHSAGKYSEAIPKYQRAKQNVEGFASTEANDLRKACTLNLSSCYLNMQEWSLCIEQCNEVLAGESDSLKALYRRGQAYMGIKGWAQAVDDLTRAVKLSNHDPAQQQLIKAKLQEAKDELSIQRSQASLADTNTDADPAPATTSSQPAPAAPSSPPRPTTTTTTTTTAPTSAASASASTVLPAANSAPGLPPNMDPQMLKQAADMMRQNPDWAQQMKRMYSEMSDDQLREMSRAMGREISREQLQGDWFNNISPEQLEQLANLQQNMPGMPPGTQFTPEMVKTAQEMMKNMSPEEIQRMTEMAAKMMPAPTAASSSSTLGTAAATATRAVTAAGGTSASSSTAVAAASSSSSGSGLPVGPGGAMPAMTPEMAKMAAEMMANMSPEQLESITAAAGAAGANVPKMTPEMAKMAADMMKNMSPEDMQRMSEMMSKGGAPGMGAGPGMAGLGVGGMPSADMMNTMDPKMMDQALSMMRSMDPQAMADMLVSTGMVKSREQAEQMARQMQNMSDSQMKMMMKAAQVVQKGAKALQKTKELASSRIVLIVGIAIIVLAIVLRVVFGW